MSPRLNRDIKQGNWEGSMYGGQRRIVWRSGSEAREYREKVKMKIFINVIL